ncbi:MULTISPECIES: GNAT family N-acetyltransferase [Streptomyces]|uniref:GNAT family protein n=2 Tax=Streptomyces violaceoruber group TaxID=2867121 RepID=A0ACD4WSA7_STRVN|nr:MULTISPECIES: GNAT family protein [Streptomyces]WOZ00442.1 GNAT family protein [Streptomyces violaceoruber]MDX2926932.1 GNAT family protein [Streptomyces sp. NRRL_B-16638]MDX3368318.1 GNAT family protein [Streptomyces sp. ME02-6987-2C]MDX3407471.1 GNAT family protein [Streptomyces sp. ME02-6977A]MDX3420160.1 GNAT family protein [Streptomyces sp. ME02-6985-2c]
MDFSEKPVLTGDRTVLRPFTAEDADTMWEIVNDPEVVRFTFEPSTELTLDGLRSWYGVRTADPDRLDLAVTDRATGELVGEVVLYEWDPAARGCTFRTLVGPRGRGRGLGSEATRLIVGHAFERVGLHRVQLEVYADNARARRVYEKAGFMVEGVRREAALRGGAWVDGVLMAVLDHEWEARARTDATQVTGEPRLYTP